MVSGDILLERNRLADRFRGSLLGVAVGDALGAVLEGKAMSDGASLAEWRTKPPFPLRYTDDTHMTLATARSLVECRGFDCEHMADTLANQYEREPWRGYGRGPPRVFSAMRHGKRSEDAARELFGGRGSYGNGGAMRAAPIGLLYCRDPGRAAELARAAARITHAHPVGQDGAGLQAAAISEILTLTATQKVDGDILTARLRNHTSTRSFRTSLDAIESIGDAGSMTVVEKLGNGVEAHRSVPTSLYAFLRHHDSFSNAVLFALSLGGDADTIGSMTGALAGAALGASAIPRSWAESVEGREELLDLADKLLDLVLSNFAVD